MKVIIGLCLIFFSNFVFAGSGGGLIQNIGGNYAGIYRIKLETTNDLASCGEGYKGFSIDVNTQGGMALYSLALSAQAQGVPVNAGGKDVCEERADTESLRWLTLPTP